MILLNNPTFFPEKNRKAVRCDIYNFVLSYIDITETPFKGHTKSSSVVVPFIEYEESNYSLISDCLFIPGTNINH